MKIVRITKRFTLEMAHALLGYDGLCRNIHGHSYILWVTLRGETVNDDSDPKNGMLMDFSVLNRTIKEHIIYKFDHSLILYKSESQDEINSLFKNYDHVIFVDFQPTCENILFDFVERINKLLPSNIELFSIKLQETENSFAEWFADDNYSRKH